MESDSFEELNQLPLQKMGPFSTKRLSQDDLDVEQEAGFSKWKRNRSIENGKGSDTSQDSTRQTEQQSDSSLFLLQGGNILDQTESVEIPLENEKGDLPVLLKQHYIREAFMEDLTDSTIDSFFRNQKTVRIFGKITQIKIRFGLDHTNKVAKLYVKRDNFAKSNPSILSILWSDINEIIEYLEGVLKDIDESIRKKEPIYKPTTIAGFVTEKPTGQEFWADESTFYTESGNFRCRVTWSLGNVYSFFFNLVKEEKVYETDKGEKFYNGPKIRLVKSEVIQFLKEVAEIKKMVPTEASIQAYINKIK